MYDLVACNVDLAQTTLFANKGKNLFLKNG